MILRGFIVLLILAWNINIAAQKPPDENLPNEVQGYKVQRARVEVKKTKRSEKGEQDEEIDEVLIRLGEPKLVGVSPLGVTFDLPVILAAIKQQGDIDRLVFADMRVNDTPVTVEDHVQPFKLPNKEALTLEPPLRLVVSAPQVVLTTIDEFLNSKEVWPVTGRIYVCGHYKKFLFKFKRAVLVELQSSIKNPLR